jgi:hypothetical protein
MRWEASFALLPSEDPGTHGIEAGWPRISQDMVSEKNVYPCQKYNLKIEARGKFYKVKFPL